MTTESTRAARFLLSGAALCLLLSTATPLTAGESHLIAADEGDAATLADGFRAVHKVGALSTGSSQVFVAVGHIPPGMSTGRHLHEIDEEILYVLEGELTVVMGEEIVTAGPGDTVFVAAQTWMELSNQSSSAAKAVLIIPRAEAEHCFRLVHGIGVETMSDGDKQAAMATCKIQMAPPPKSDG